MGIQKYMVAVKFSFCVLLIVLLVAAVSFIEKKETHDEFVSELLDSPSGLFDEHTAKVLWSTCWEDSIRLKKEVEDHDLRLPQESSGSTNRISSETQPFVRADIQKLIACHPQFKENFIQCWRKNNLPFHVSGEEDDFKIWHVTYMGSLFSKSSVPRRNLGRVLLQHISEPPSPGPKPLHPPLSPTPFFPKLTPPAIADISSPPSPVINKQEDKHSNRRTVVIAVVITALVTFIAAALFFLYCSGFCKTGRVRKNDERPLLSLSMSDFSVGPSNYSFGNSIKGEKVGFQSSNDNLLDNKKTSVQESQSIGALTAAGSPFELKPPPGRVGTIPSGMPPLKPPPGRLNPLPPEPPSFRPSGPPRPPPPIGPKVARPLANVEAGAEGEAGAPKAKLKPFFWDKVQANSDHSMVWNQIKSGSFQFNEEMIETLFGYNAVDKNNGQRQKESTSQDPSPQYIQIIDKKKSQNLLILLRALNVTMEEVCDALYEGNELPSEFLQTLLKMAPTSDEELKLRLFSGELSQLGPADRFLKALVDIPFAFKRMEALLFMSTLNEELTTTMESFAVLEVACKELRNSRLFLKLLEAVLKTGNRMNDGTYRGGAQAFKLDTLLKLSDVKGTDGKTTLLHFVVQEIIRSEGIKAARAAKESKSSSSIKTDETEDHYREIGLQVVSHLSSELENVKKAAVLDADSLTATASKLAHGLIKTKNLVNENMKNVEEDRGFCETTKSFVQNAEVDVMKLMEEEKKIMALVKSTGDYFHGNAGKDEGLRLFVVVRDFIIMLDKVCKEVREAQKRAAKTLKQETSRGSSSSETRPPPSDFRQRLFPAIAERRMGDSSSDDESP
ncbi:Formin, FH2 domain [Sesbania bispinosa]|nr:Formin, FH2 domain [Sesbania bispinosa]